MAAMNPEQLLKPLHWITGTWKSINATVNYPTMKSPINYKELLSFTNFGFLLLGYSSLTWNPETKALMHVEGGHLRIAEDGCTVSLLTSQNLGICTVEDGTVKGKTRYFQVREQWRVTDLLFNPMIMMMVLPLLLIMVLPKMMNDPETKKEMEQIQNMAKFEMSDFVFNYLAKSSSSQTDKDKVPAAIKKNQKARKRIEK